MTWWKWFPWRFIVRHVARRHGFVDPIALLSRLHAFAQPSEVGEPIELLRAGVVFHARGLINSRVIQHNLDWVWPYWVERQFDPLDPSFVPRAFSITHVNLTQRNWTAVGYPDVPELPIVDPRGLLTPFLDGWSLDGWLLGEDGRCLLPSRAQSARQCLTMQDGLAILTETQEEGLTLESRAWVELESGLPVCKLHLKAHAERPAWLILALRPQNPEGVSFIHEVHLLPERKGWIIDRKRKVHFSAPAARHHVCAYREGDVFIHLKDLHDQDGGVCDVGMITAAALFPVAPGEGAEIIACVPLAAPASRTYPAQAWEEARRPLCRLECPEPHYQFLYDAALSSLILHSPDDVYPGPYTYKRFWFRDAAFILHAMLCVGMTERAERALERFPKRQTGRGYFRSQEGEWDSNGEVLWILKRYYELTGHEPHPRWQDPVRRAAQWIMRKRLPEAPESPHAGLLPAGFSAEHLGPNDYYYWDDFWGVAGLRAAAWLAGHWDGEQAQGFAHEADAFQAAIERSLARAAARLGRPAMPASPYRRLDAGAIGSLAMGYPLELCEADDPRLLDSVEFLLERCFVKGAFYQDMIHSGLNAYLTLAVAQVLLRAQDARYLELMDTVAALASPTGQWPEAIHPLTGGGCMGDGQHVWAAAEWVLMLRHCFLREEGDGLILCAGVPQRWLAQGQPIRFGPAPTAFGTLSLAILPSQDGPRIEWQAAWRREPARIEIRLPGHKPLCVAPGAASAVLSPVASCA